MTVLDFFSVLLTWILWGDAIGKISQKKKLHSVIYDSGVSYRWYMFILIKGTSRWVSQNCNNKNTDIYDTEHRWWPDKPKYICCVFIVLILWYSLKGSPNLSWVFIQTTIILSHKYRHIVCLLKLVFLHIIILYSWEWTNRPKYIQ